ncbi:16S rRNA (cytidine(1402)-2'-O)-methyltransferase [Peptoniphilus catoniae]|uniref:16S rRNA (cytidine(1402)-2'-O)-methyltransferase n=1 Tax=Peptoniphilus catoniae TaxID=1660341 RepID=UPI0010FD44F9|nr:16S rRNA (cytidine(1402)-2'-O)-methyltransferase [Peptoniphilus catoniae]
MIYFCATPIGNLKDIGIRTLEILRSVDLIACEDTRTSLKLLNEYNIKKPLISYHKFNESSKAEELIELSREKDIALITDAGLPGISDPGEVLVKRLINEKIDFRVVPGANAALTGLVLSGLSSEHFLFYGFLKAKSSARKKELEGLKNIKYTLIFYEAPHRLKDSLIDIYEVLGNRSASISREITKLFEETLRGNLKDLLDMDLTLKGEFVIVVEGNSQEEVLDLEELLREKLDLGIKKSQAVKELAKEYKVSKNELYKISLEVDNEQP